MFTLSSIFVYPSFALRPVSPSNSSGLKEEIRNRLAVPTAGLEETRVRESLGESLALFHKLRSGGVAAEPAAALGDRYLPSPVGEDWFICHEVMVLTDEQTKKKIVQVSTRYAVRIPVNPDSPVPIGSANHRFCNLCVARGWNPQEKRYELVQWHFEPPYVFSSQGQPPIPPSRLIAGLPDLLWKLEDVRIVLSPRIDQTAYPDLVELEIEWGKELGHLPFITVIPRARGVRVSSILTKDGVGLYLTRGSLEDEPSGDFQSTVSDPERFLVLRWDDLKEHQLLPMLQMPPVFVEPGLIGLDMTGENTREQHQGNVMKMLGYLGEIDSSLYPARTRVVNIGSGVNPLLGQLPWEWVTNWDPAVSAGEAAHALGADYQAVDVARIPAALKSHPVSPEKLPKVLLLYRKEFLEGAWTILSPGGWLVLMDPPSPPFSVPTVHEIYRALLDAIAPQFPRDIRIVSPDGDVDHALAIAVRKPYGAGLEENEILPVLEFHRKYGDRLEVNEKQRRQFEEWWSRGDVRATVIGLPARIPLYVQGDPVFWKVVDDLLPRMPSNAVFVPILLPTLSWNDFGIILRDPMFPELENPRGLQVREVEPGQVSALDPMELLLQIFRSRLNIPGSEHLGILVFTDEEGRARLVSFDA